MRKWQFPVVAVLLSIPAGCAFPVSPESEVDGDDLASDLEPAAPPKPYDSSKRPRDPPDPCVVGMKHVAGGHTFILPVPCHRLDLGDRGDPPPEEVGSPFDESREPTAVP